LHGRAVSTKDLNQLFDRRSCHIVYRIGYLDRATDRVHVRFFPVDPQSFVDCCVDISHCHHSVRYMGSLFIASADYLPAADAAAAQNQGPAMITMIASVPWVEVWSAPKFTHRNQDRGFQ